MMDDIFNGVSFYHWVFKPVVFQNVPYFVFPLDVIIFKGTIGVSQTDLLQSVGPKFR